MNENLLNRNTKIRNKSGQFVKGENINDLVGKKFGKLTVLRLDKIVNRKSYWIVQCECGNVKSVRCDTLKKIVSCGCEKKKQDIINLGIVNHHNLTYHPAYGIWHHMISRCENTLDHAYKDYGGRGIKVCQEWHDLRTFCKWAEENGYEKDKGLSIERIDVNGDYCPENCCWIPRKDQSRNRRCCIRLIINGEDKLLSQWAYEYGLDNHEYNKVYQRYKRGYRDVEHLFAKKNLKPGPDPKEKLDAVVKEVFR